jgi:hypothetical protein
MAGSRWRRDIALVQAALGHRSIMSTLVCAKANEASVRAAFA